MDSEEPLWAGEPDGRIVHTGLNLLHGKAGSDPDSLKISTAIAFWNQ